MKVKLEDIIEAMEFAGMETEYYYDTQNEKVVMLFDGMVDGEDNPKLFEDIKEGFVEDYIPLPGQYDINEYRIMEEFIYELPAGKNQDVLERENYMLLREHLAEYTREQLLDQARSFELKKFSGLRKAALIDRIMECFCTEEML